MVGRARLKLVLQHRDSWQGGLCPFILSGVRLAPPPTREAGTLQTNGGHLDAGQHPFSDTVKRTASPPFITSLGQRHCFKRTRETLGLSVSGRFQEGGGPTGSWLFRHRGECLFPFVTGFHLDPLWLIVHRVVCNGKSARVWPRDVVRCGTRELSLVQLRPLGPPAPGRTGRDRHVKCPVVNNRIAMQPEDDCCSVSVLFIPDNTFCKAIIR